MSDYTPTTEEIRDRASRAPSFPRFTSPTLQADFDRWLAAHDAEVRAEAWDVGAKAMMRAVGEEQTVSFIAPVNPYRDDSPTGVVAEEPEWGFESPQPGLWYVTRNPMLAETMAAGKPDAVLFVRKAGGWVLVNQEEAET